MNIHKNPPYPTQRQAVWRAHMQDKINVTSLARQYQVSRVISSQSRALAAARPAKKHQQPLQTSQIRNEAFG